MITTMEALNYAIDILKQQPQSKKNDNMIAVLSKMRRRDVFIKWDKESIIQTLMEFKERNGYAPTTTNLAEYGMPSPLTIQSHFHITPSLFLKQLFPELRTEKAKPKNVYGFVTEQDWLNCFIEQFNKHIEEDMSSKKYNIIKDKDTPQWETIARHCRINGWTELMKKTGVKYKNKQYPTANNIRVVSCYSPSLERIEKLTEERKQLQKELLEIISNKKF